MEETSSRFELRSEITYSGGQGIVVLRAEWLHGEWYVSCPHAEHPLVRIATREDVLATGKVLEPFVLAAWEAEGRWDRARQALKAAVALEAKRLAAAAPSAVPPEGGSTMGDHASSQL